MANNYIAKIRAELDSASLQEQIDKIVKKSGTIKVKVETDGDLSAFVKDVSKKVEAAGNVTIKPKVDTAELDSGMGTLSRTITRIVNDSTQSVENIFKSVGNGFDRTVSQVDGETKKITQDYESYVKRVSVLEKQINDELDKSLSYIVKMQEGTEERLALEKKLYDISSGSTSKESLSAAERLTEEAKEQLSAEKSRISIQERINGKLNEASSYISKMTEGTQERLVLEKKLDEISSGGSTQENLNKAKQLTMEAREQLSVEKSIISVDQKINAELEKTSSYISKMKEGTSERAELEKKLSDLSGAETDEKTLTRAKQLTAEAKEKLDIEKKELSVQEQIDNKIKEIKTRMEAVKMSSSQRLEIEKKIEDAMAMENSKDRLSALKNINTEITAMGKNAMSLGAMLQTAYEKFANKLRLCTEMCIEKQCVYAGKS